MGQEEEEICKPIGSSSPFTRSPFSTPLRLLIPERNQRIHARGPARRQIAGDHRHYEHQQRREQQ